MCCPTNMKENGSVVENKKSLKNQRYLKKITLPISRDNINVNDVNALVNRNRKQPMVAKKSLPGKGNANHVGAKVEAKVNTNAKGVLVRPGSEAFYKIFIHSKKCVSCENPKCKKMKMIQAHFMACTRSGQNCPLCKQFIGLLATFVNN